MTTVRRYYVEVRNSSTCGYYWQEVGAYPTRAAAEARLTSLRAAGFGEDNTRVNEAWAFGNSNVSEYEL